MSSIDGLRACSLFKDFTDTGVQILASIATPKLYPKGTPLFVESMVGDSLLVLTEGSVKLTAKNAQGDEVPLGDVGAPGHLGELALVVQGGQRLCTAIAVTPVSALELRHSDFQKLMQQKPQACLKLLMAVVGELGEKLAANRDAFRALLPRK